MWALSVTGPDPATIVSRGSVEAFFGGTAQGETMDMILSATQPVCSFSLASFLMVGYTKADTQVCTAFLEMTMPISTLHSQQT
jgi:hypothetical protein